MIPQTVLITHIHNDHIGGLGDFADLCFWQESRAKVISPPEMIEGLKRRFPYLGPARQIEFVAAIQTTLGAWQVSFHQVNHGVNGYAYAIRFQGPDSSWIYMPDAFQATSAQLAALHHVDLLIMGASEWDESSWSPSHRAIYDVQEALSMKQELNAKQIVLTHLSHNIDIPQHGTQLPPGVQFAVDGMELSLP